MKCKHKRAYRFHENAPVYCPECRKYLSEEEYIHSLKNELEKTK